MLYNPAGQWNDLSCDIAKNYICRKEKTGTDMTAPTEDNSGCPSGFTRWNDACYLYIS